MIVPMQDFQLDGQLPVVFSCGDHWAPLHVKVFC